MGTEEARKKREVWTHLSARGLQPHLNVEITTGGFKYCRCLDSTIRGSDLIARGCGLGFGTVKSSPSTSDSDMQPRLRTSSLWGTERSRRVPGTTASAG